MTMIAQDLPIPDYSHNLEIIGHSDQGGRPDGVQLMVNKGYAKDRVEDAIKVVVKNDAHMTARQAAE